MPLYDYQCQACNHKWEQFASIANREGPLQEPCPKCGTEGSVSKVVTAGRMGDPMKMGKIKPEPWLNDRLRDIKKHNPGSTINIRD